MTLPLPSKRHALGSGPDLRLLHKPPGPAGLAGPAPSCGTQRASHCRLLKGHQPPSWRVGPASLLPEVNDGDIPACPALARRQFSGSKHLQTRVESKSLPRSRLEAGQAGPTAGASLPGQLQHLGHHGPDPVVDVVQRRLTHEGRGRDHLVLLVHVGFVRRR